MRRAWTLALLLLGCGGHAPEEPRHPGDAAPPPPAAVVTRVHVDDRTPADRRPAPVPEDELTALARAALTEAGLVVAPKPVPGAWRITVDLEVVYGVTDGTGIAAKPGPGTAKAVWEASLKMRPPETEEAFYGDAHGADEAAFSGDAAALPAALRERLRAALRPVAHAVRTRAEVLAKDAPALIAELSDADPDARVAAASRLAMVRSADAVPALAARIRAEKDREVTLRMVGALAEIGDERAVDALIHLADPKDRELLGAVIDALASIGGPRVTDFFDILSNHDSADVRQMVDEARRHLAKGKAP
jgi:hypothetical protein